MLRQDCWLVCCIRSEQVIHVEPRILRTFILQMDWPSNGAAAILSQTDNEARSMRMHMPARFRAANATGAIQMGSALLHCKASRNFTLPISGDDIGSMTATNLLMPLVVCYRQSFLGLRPGIS